MDFFNLDRLHQKGLSSLENTKGIPEFQPSKKKERGSDVSPIISYPSVIEKK